MLTHRARAALLFLLLLAARPATAQPLTLQDCLERAAQRNPRIAVAHQEVALSSVGVRLQRTELMPHIRTDLFGYSYSRFGDAQRRRDYPTGMVDPKTGRQILRDERILLPGYSRSTYNSAVEVSYPLFDGGQRRHRYDAAKTTVEAASGELAWVQVQVAAQVKETYFLLLKSIDLATVQAEALQLSERRLELARTRLTMKVGAAVDTLRARLALANAHARKLEADHEVARMSDLLRELIVTPGDQPLEVAAVAQAPPSISAADVDDLVATALDDSPALRQLRAAVAAATHSVAAAHAARYPEVGGVAGYGRGGESLRRTYSQFDKNWKVGFTLVMSYDVFDGGRRGAEAARAQAQLDMLRLQVEEERINIGREVRSQCWERSRLDELQKIAAAAVELAARDQALMTERYRLGDGTLPEALNGELELVQARTLQTQVRYDMHIAHARLEQWVGEAALSRQLGDGVAAPLPQGL